MHDMKLNNQIVTHENARHENDGPICRIWKQRTNFHVMQMQEMKLQAWKSRTMLDAKFVQLAVDPELLQWRNGRRSTSEDLSK